MKKPFHVVLCVLNAKYIHSSLAPWCLLAGVKAFCRAESLAGITTEVVEGTINEPVEELAEIICAKNPQVIGFSCYIWNITATKQLLRLVKGKLPDAVIVLGGPEVSFNAEEVLRKEPAVQYVISGEGEKPFALLLQAIYDGTVQGQDKVREIPGVCSRKEQEIVIVPPELPAGDPPSPYSPEYFAALKGRMAYLETSRGCLYACAFCLSGRSGSVRFFDFERTKKEMLLLANSGTRTVKLVDRTFNCNRQRALELFRFIIENYGGAIPSGVCFHFEIAGDLLDKATLNLLATAPVGAIQFEIGIQSFNAQTLDAINRRTDVEHLQKNIRRLIASGNMHIHIDLIAGLPFEDLDSFAASFNTAYALKPHLLQLGFLKLLHGAPMREEPARFPCRYHEEPPYEVLETPWLSAEELVRLHHTEDALDRLYNSGRFQRTLAYVLAQTGYRPFTLFAEFGEFAAAQGLDQISLDDFTALAFTYFSKLRGIDHMALRDVMVCDRLTTNKSGRLPDVLRVPDAALKKAINRWNSSGKNEAGTGQKGGVKRSYAYLYSEQCLVYVDYQEEERNPITGEYPLKKVCMPPSFFL